MNISKIGSGVANAIKIGAKSSEAFAGKTASEIAAKSIATVAKSEVRNAPLLIPKPSVIREVGDVFQFAPKSASLSIEDKIKILSEKTRRNFSPEDIANPIFRQNVDKFYETLLKDEKTQALRSYYLGKRIFTFSPEAFSYIGDDINSCIIMRACLRNYPMEVIDFAGRAEKGMKKFAQFEPKINLGADKEYGESLIEWYQKTFQNSSEVNNALRQSQPLSKKAEEIVAFFDSHQRPLGKNTTLIRGTDFLQVLKPGDIIADKGYMSCATINGFIDNVDNLPGSRFTRYKDFLVIKVPGNQKMIVPMDYKGLIFGKPKDDMGERILPRGIRLKVLDIYPLTDYGKPGTGAGIINDRRTIICDIL